MKYNCICKKNILGTTICEWFKKDKSLFYGWCNKFDVDLSAKDIEAFQCKKSLAMKIKKERKQK